MIHVLMLVYIFTCPPALLLWYKTTYTLVRLNYLLIGLGRNLLYLTSYLYLTLQGENKPCMVQDGEINECVFAYLVVKHLEA